MAVFEFEEEVAGVDRAEWDRFLERQQASARGSQPILNGDGEVIGSYVPHSGAQAAFFAEPPRSDHLATHIHRSVEDTPMDWHGYKGWRIPADRTRGIVVLGTENAEIDWHATMRDCVAEASVLADRVAATDTDAGEALQRLCNVVAHLLDENKALSARLASRVSTQAEIGMGLVQSMRDMVLVTSARLAALERENGRLEKRLDAHMRSIADLLAIAGTLRDKGVIA